MRSRMKKLFGTFLLSAALLSGCSSMRYADIDQSPAQPQEGNATITFYRDDLNLDDKALTRAHMDYALDFDIERIPTIEEFEKKYKNWTGFYVTRYSQNIYSSMNYSDETKDYYFMFGRESSGIPYDILKKHLDKTIRIPMAINARSLNLSDSVSIIISEVKRQQNFSSLSLFETIKGKDFLKR